MGNKERIETYDALASKLSLLSQDRLLKLLSNCESVTKSIGGTSAIVRIDKTPIFIKKIPLTDLEKKPENRMSTRNIFELPLYYQYGVGSAGFGVWRELACHLMTTDWVIKGQCANFPLLYHWRILPRTKSEITPQELEKLAWSVNYWQDSLSVRNRLMAKLEATDEVVLFMEYFPRNLYAWLGEKIVSSNHAADEACEFVERELQQIIAFINAHGLIHFDAHLANIVTDGANLYFADFGLGLSSQFELSAAEIKFFNQHNRYDFYSTMTNFLHCIITNLFGSDNWSASLQACVNISDTKITPFVTAILKRYAAIALLMDEFYRKLQYESKDTPYPKNELDYFYNKIGS